jgi:hypothetical protein
MDHEKRRLTFPTSRRLAARSVESNLDARRLKGRADALCRIGILRGVAEEDTPPVCAPTRFSESTSIPAPLVVLCRAENALRSQSHANVAVRCLFEHLAETGGVQMLIDRAPAKHHDCAENRS